MKLFIIHPGIQHAPRLANGALRAGLFEKVSLITSVLFKPGLPVFSLLKKRVKPIDAGVQIINHYTYTLLFTLTKAIHNKFFANPHDQSHNNPIYFWQQIFGYLSLPRIYFNRKNLLVVCFETTGWPIVKYCKKWNIPVVMDFASISHEKALELGINETKSGIKIKTLERQYIDYAFFCSTFCKESFAGKTSSKQDFTLYLGADINTNNSNNIKVKEINDADKIKICFIANLEYRKGLDFLLDALLTYKKTTRLILHLIGRINKVWVDDYLNNRILPSQVTLIYQTALPQKELFKYLAAQNFDLNIQPSRFDSFAMVVPETMMLGIPNIVSPFVGAGETLINNFNGYVMEELSAKNLTSKINNYIDLSLNDKLMLKNNVLKSALKMDWQNYYVKLAKSLNIILKNL